MKESDIAWSRSLFNMLNEGGIWAVTRSGLMFQKKGTKLVLIDRMPFDPAMVGAGDLPQTAEALSQYQDEDFECIAKHFRAAKIEVEDATKPV